jgi:hypothetical protein
MDALAVEIGFAHELVESAQVLGPQRCELGDQLVE